MKKSNYNSGIYKQLEEVLKKLDKANHTITQLSFNNSLLVSEIKELLDSMIEANLGEDCKLTEDEKIIFAKAAQGLTLQEAENAFANVLEIDICMFLCNNIFVSENEKRPNRPKRRIT